MTEFFQTRMGRTFYEHTVPELVRQLVRLNANLERITTTENQGLSDEHDEDEKEPQDPRADRG